MELGRFWWWATLVLFPLCIHGCFGCWEEERIGSCNSKRPSTKQRPLSSWSSTNQERDCCRWERVYCHNTTGRVIHLDLGMLRVDHWWKEHWYLNASLFLPFQELNSLDLSFNRNYGWVSNEGLERFSRLSKLEELSFDWNFINDSFLSSIGAIASLKKLNLKGNGPIHTPAHESLKLSLAVSELGRLNNLQELYLDNSQTEKSILQRVGIMTSLNVFSISGCGLQGWFPDKGWCELRNLQELKLSDNDFEGMLPSCLANMTALRFLSLSHNHFNESISHISSLPSLEYLDLSNNHFAPISFSSFFNLSRLKILIMDNLVIDEENESQPWASTSTQLYVVGMLPRWLGNLSFLKNIAMTNNKLEGPIPRELSGPLPSSLKDNLALVTLELSYNNLTGYLPDWIGNLSSLSILLLRHNHLQVEAVQEVEFTTKRRSDIYKGNILDYMSGIDLSSNQLTGKIPHELGNLSNIHALNLSYNSLTGSIPITFSKLPNREFGSFQ
ncbi:LRR receptor-like serine/threonine-protein kinase GSO1 [Morella rubra]|uniref:LRR receptor-like serine/threonine-protein kinase GSO1 n=1 Tax=Morella rubra TaxID=262757 RepID=A0A6A1V7Y9_9ROSI|nr:LRR receptor-like serine/threonine-protein kinase GSO1 [Morella rubra]